MDFEWFDGATKIALQIGDFLKNLWVWIASIAPTIDGICLSFITYYTFRLTVFPKKIRFINFKLARSAFEGDSLEITLENRSLCPAVIESVDLILGSKKVQIFSGECIIDGFKTAKIEMPRYSQIISSDGPLDIGVCSLGDISLLVKTTRGIQHIRYARISKLAWRRIQKLEEKYERTTVCRNQCGNRVVSSGIRYAIAYVDQQGDSQIVFVHKSGTMSAAPFGYNGLPEEVMKSESTMRNHLDAEFEKYKLSYQLIVFRDPFVTEDVDEQQEKKP